MCGFLISANYHVCSKVLLLPATQSLAVLPHVTWITTGTYTYDFIVNTASALENESCHFSNLKVKIKKSGSNFFRLSTLHVHVKILV